jgi:hypothetical protein
VSGLQETFYVGSEATRQRAMRALAAAPIYDDKDRQLVVIIKRAATAFGASKKRKFHAYVNLLADYREVPAPAMKSTLKAHLCPLVEEMDVITGEVKFVTKGVSQLSDEEAAELCEKTVKLAREEWDLPLPISDEEWVITKYGGLTALIEREAATDQSIKEGS